MVSLICSLWHTFLQANDLLNRCILLHDEDCGTLEDPNYRLAFYALQDAIKVVIGSPSEYAFFPSASDEIYDACGNPFFSYEGKISWNVQTWPSTDFLCKRIIQQENPINLAPHAMQQSDANLLIIEKGIHIFKLHKDYAAFLSAFDRLQKDLDFLWENNRGFFRKCISYIRTDQKQYSFWKFGPLGHTIPLNIKDLNNLIRDYRQRYNKYNQRLEAHSKNARTYCKQSLDYCIAYHHNPLAHINRGLFDYLDGNILDALDHLETALKKSKAEELEALKKNALLLKGRSELELGLYADAILTLTEQIECYPENKDAYLERAAAYFELGNFDSSLRDYLTSNIKPDPVSPQTTDLFAFSLGLAKGIVHAGTQAGIEFIPSLLSSLQGIGHGLWVFAQDPVQISRAFVQSAQECIHFIKEHTTQEIISELTPEIKDLITQWDQLKNEQRGEGVGNVIGKYGVDIFAGAGLTKVMKSYRELKRANNLLTFEAMAISKRNQSLIQIEASRKSQARKEILRYSNLKIQSDKQGKHVIGHKNYLPSEKKSILSHSNPQKLIDEFAGKGMKITDLPPGVPGYQEVVNCGECIGYVVNVDTGEKIATNWGKIHYAKDGVHIVPTKTRR